MRLPPILFAAFLALSACSDAKGQTVSGLYPAGALVDQTVVTLDGSGNATWNYAVQFPSTPAVVHLPKSVNTSDALICNWTAITQTSVSILAGAPTRWPRSSPDYWADQQPGSK